MREKPELKDIPIEQLQRGEFQPRRQFNEEELNELAASIQSAGIIQPIVVRPKVNGNYEIVAGERRWRAAQIAQLEVVPCLINQYSDEQTAAITTIENINRVDLNPIEEANAYARMIDAFGYLHEEIAAAVGKSRSKITNALRLLKLEKPVQALLIDKQLSEGHGKILAGLAPNSQIKLAEKCLAHGWSVRQLENEIKRALANVENSSRVDPNIKALELALSDHVGCPATISTENRKFQLSLSCHNLEIFQGLLDKIGFKNKT